jgi:formylglycine-generating enzyme required for sulfatase activity
MVVVPVPMTGPDCDSFEIDSTETTQAEYEEFLSVRHIPSAEPNCDSDLDILEEGFEPDPTKFGTLGLGPDLPVYAVNWCAARAYCEWAGKRLCTGEVPLGAPTDHCLYGSSAWQVACSGDCTARYGYGDAYEPDRCNVYPAASGGLVPVGSLPDCHAGYPGVFDMLGNAWEWTAGNGTYGSLEGTTVMADNLGGGTDLLTCWMSEGGGSLAGRPLLAGIRCCR